jgi:hypothetical protein
MHSEETTTKTSRNVVENECLVLGIICRVLMAERVTSLRTIRHWPLTFCHCSVWAVEQEESTYSIQLHFPSQAPRAKVRQPVEWHWEREK